MKRLILILMILILGSNEVNAVKIEKESLEYKFEVMSSDIDALESEIELKNETIQDLENSLERLKKGQ